MVREVITLAIADNSAHQTYIMDLQPHKVAHQNYKPNQQKVDEVITQCRCTCDDNAKHNTRSAKAKATRTTPDKTRAALLPMGNIQKRSGGNKKDGLSVPYYHRMTTPQYRVYTKHATTTAKVLVIKQGRGRERSFGEGG